RLRAPPGDRGASRYGPARPRGGEAAMKRGRWGLPILMMAGAIVAAWWWHARATAPAGWQGYVEADYVRVGPTQQGLLTAIPVARRCALGDGSRPGRRGEARADALVHGTGTGDRGPGRDDQPDARPVGAGRMAAGAASRGLPRGRAGRRGLCAGRRDAGCGGA